jgi:hypothetical protein
MDHTGYGKSYAIEILTGLLERVRIPSLREWRLYLATQAWR